MSHASRIGGNAPVIHRSREEGVNQAHSASSRLIPVVMQILSFYKPLNYVLALGSTGLRAHFSWKAAEGKDLQYPAGFNALVDVAAVAATLFAHPAGMFLLSAKDCITAVTEFKACLKEEDYTGAMEQGAQIANNALYLALFASGSVQIAVASLMMQVMLGLYHAQSAYQREDYIEAIAHLAVVTVLGKQLHQHVSSQQVVSPAKKEGAGEVVPAQKEITYKVQENTAQYGNADWSGLKEIKQCGSLDEAKAYADADPNITYFFYMKGWRMCLTGVKHALFPRGCAVFHEGDAVFFTDKNKMWLGTAPGFSDTYVKQS